jgi:hypothetical protein
MATALSSNTTLTFSINQVPAKASHFKTLERLMRMEPRVAQGLRRLQSRRQREDNKPHQRGGRMWISRVKSSKLVHVARGESFTLYVTPQILPDLKAVEQYLDVKSAS